VVASPSEDLDMIEGLLADVGAVIAWFGDPANWTGNDGIPNRLVEHLVLCLVSMALALAIALPIGLYIGHTGRFSLGVQSVANIGRAVPSYALMAIVFPVTIALSIGVAGNLAFIATVIAMVLLAIPPMVTNTWAGIGGVDPDLREAARGLGMQGHQVLRGLEVPLALAVILTGVRVASVQVVATATLGAVFGGGGLGRYIVQGFARRDDARLWAGAFMVALLAIMVELGFAWLIRRTERRSGRSTPGEARSDPAVADAAPSPGAS
jgi:osmoprotectant transport system permease protein